jgi:hypothetical protein
MKADLTRNTFHPLKQFTQVVMQQGRVQLDADWNEQSSILLNFMRSLAADLIGPHGGPAANLGFRIADGNVATDFALTPGRYYVDGILCELAPPFPPVAVESVTDQPRQFKIPPAWEANFAKGQPVLLAGEGRSVLASITGVNNAVVTVDSDVSKVLGSPNVKAYLKPVTFLTQPDYPIPAGTQSPQDGSLIYLDVWERLITDIEDDSIREVALNGADTAARVKLVCQVKQLPGPVAAFPDDLKSHFQPANRGRLAAQAKQIAAATDPCTIAPDATYRGPENQLYRVEIHTGGSVDMGMPPTFKWSRENAFVVFPIVSFTPGSGTVILENLGRDDRFGLNENDWVELQDDDSVLLNAPGNLLQIQSIDRANLTVTLSGGGPTISLKKHPLLRRWDHAAGDPAEGGLQLAADGAALITEDSSDANWLSLEDGIQIQFRPAAQGSSNTYRTGDYWLIPARTATGDVEWPKGTSGPLALSPAGVDHHYAPLAIINVKTAPGGVLVKALRQYQFDRLQLPN